MAPLECPANTKDSWMTTTGFRTLDEFNQKHKGTPAFIVGSGPSIHGLDLEPLKDYVTIAVNAGYLAVPNADYTLSDDWEVAVWSYFANDLRQSDKTIALLYEQKLKDKASWFGDRSVLFQHRTGYHITDKYEHNNPENHIVQCRTSAASAIHVAHIMGCSSIVVLGLDCCRVRGMRWFWQFPGWQQPRRLDGKKADKYIHRKPSSDSDLDSILEYWTKQGRFINEACTVYNASEISKINVFPKKSLNEIIKCLKM